MIKIKLLTLFTFVYSLTVVAQKSEPSFKRGANWGFYNLKGNVRTVSILDYHLKDKFGEYIKDDQTIRPTNISFDEQGLIVLTTSERQIEKTEYGENRCKITYFDEKEPSKVLSMHINTYDKKGYLIESKSYNSNGDLTFTWTTKYKDGYIQESKSELLDDTNPTIRITTYRYEGNKRIATSPSFLNKNTREVHIETYNTKNQLIEFKWFEGKVRKQRYTCQFDEQGHRTQKIDYDAKDKIKGQEYLKYDNYGNEISLRRVEANGKVWIRTFKYEYDTKGNYTKKVAYENGVPKYAEERMITYF